MKIELNNKLPATIRMLPALDAFAAALENRVVYRTQYPELMAGKPYKATNQSIDIDGFLPNYAELKKKHKDIAELAYSDLRSISGDEKLYFPAAAKIPTVNIDWDPGKLMCHKNRYVRNAVVCLCRRSSDPKWFSGTMVSNVLSPLATKYPVINIILGDDAPLIPNALEVSNHKYQRMGEGKTVDYYDDLSLLTIMKAMTVGSVVVTNINWGYSLSVALRLKTVILRPEFRSWTNSFDTSVVPEYAVCSGYACTSRDKCSGGLECPMPLQRSCLSKYDAAAIRDVIVGMLNGQNN